MSIRMRHTKGHTGNRRSHHALSTTKTVKDASSGALRLPHRVDETTGMYRGKQIFSPKAKAPKSPEHKHAHSHAHEHEHDHAHAPHEHANAELTSGVKGKVPTGGRPKARSGMGGQAS